MSETDFPSLWDRAEKWAKQELKGDWYGEQVAEAIADAMTGPLEAFAEEVLVTYRQALHAELRRWLNSKPKEETFIGLLRRLFPLEEAGVSGRRLDTATATAPENAEEAPSRPES